MATIGGPNNNITRSSKRLDYSIINMWNKRRSNGESFYEDNGSYSIALKNNPLVRIFPNVGGFEIIHSNGITVYQSCIVDVTVIVNLDNTKIYIVGPYRPTPTTIERPPRTDSYFTNIISPFVPDYDSI
jgi:hypothetical protein